METFAKYHAFILLKVTLNSHQSSYSAEQYWNFTDNMAFLLQYCGVTKLLWHEKIEKPYLQHFKLIITGEC